MLFSGVSIHDIVRGWDLIGEFGAGFKGERFGEDEGVVAVEEDVRCLAAQRRKN